jgi:RsiW-degrading membrane proteinase PrsW (M82 family)
MSTVLTTEEIPVPEAERAAQLRAIDEAGYGVRYRFVQPHNAAFWVYCLIVLAGALRMAQQLGPQMGVYGGAIVAGLIVFALYTVPFWLFINQVDRYEPQSRKLTVVAFVWGGLGATFGMAVTANDPIRAIYGKVLGQAFAFDWGAALTAPFVEEIVKACGLVLIITMAPRLVRSAFDGAVLGAFIGLGFTVFEDLIYVLVGAMSGFGADQGAALSSTLFMRIATGLVSHTVYSAIFGMGLVWLIGRPHEPRRIGRGLAFIVSAMALHGAWDSMGALSRGTLFGALGSFVILPAALIGLLALGIRWASRQERTWMHDIMQPEVTRGTITADELAALSGHHKDRKRFIKDQQGHKGHVHAKHVLSAASDLAQQIGRARGADTPEVEFARAEVTRLRAA